MIDDSILAKVPSHLRPLARKRLICKSQLEKIFPGGRIFITLPGDNTIIGTGKEPIKFRALIKHNGTIIDLRGSDFDEILRQAQNS